MILSTLTAYAGYICPYTVPVSKTQCILYSAFYSIISSYTRMHLTCALPPPPLLPRIGNEMPTIPTEVGARDIDHNSATIEWTMQTLTCAEETFEVQYGESESALDNSKSLPSSGMDVSQENVQLSVELSGLASCTLYYYRVVVTNSAGSSASGVNSFRTLSASGKLPFTKFNQRWYA